MLIARPCCFSFPSASANSTAVMRTADPSSDCAAARRREGHRRGRVGLLRLRADGGAVLVLPRRVAGREESQLAEGFAVACGGTQAHAHAGLVGAVAAQEGVEEIGELRRVLADD